MTLSKFRQHAYILSFVIIHIGSAVSGHYFCYVKNLSDATQWFKCNDDTITEIAEDKLFESIPKDGIVIVKYAK